MLRECAGSVTWNVLERTGTPAITGPEVMWGVTVGGVWVLMMLYVRMGVVLGV